MLDHTPTQTTMDSSVSKPSLADECTVNEPRLLLDWSEFGEPISLLLAKCGGTAFADLTVLENIKSNLSTTRGLNTVTWFSAFSIAPMIPHGFVTALFAIFAV